MSLVAVLRRVETILCFSGFVLLICALGADFIWRAFGGEGRIGASHLAVTGMVVMALFGVGVAAHVGSHSRPRLVSVLPVRWQRSVAGIGHFVTSVFFLGLFSLAVYTCVESQVLGELTVLSGLPLWVLQGAMVIAFALNSFRYLLYAFDPHVRPVGQDLS